MKPGGSEGQFFLSEEQKLPGLSLPDREVDEEDAIPQTYRADRGAGLSNPEENAPAG